MSATTIRLTPRRRRDVGGQHAERAGADHADPPRRRLVPLSEAEGVDGVGERLDERGRLERHPLRQHVHVALGHRNQLGEGAGALDADDRARAADVRLAALAGVAAAAGDERVDDDVGAVGDAHPRELMTHDQRRDAERALRREALQLRPADADRLDGDDDIPLARDGFGHVLDPQLVRPGVHHSLQSTALPLSESAQPRP